MARIAYDAGRNFEDHTWKEGDSHCECGAPMTFGKRTWAEHLRHGPTESVLDEVRNQARDEGYEDGYSNGEKQGRTEGRDDLRRKLTRWLEDHR